MEDNFVPGQLWDIYHLILDYKWLQKDKNKLSM
jgi:hypothetical protein